MKILCSNGIQQASHLCLREVFLELSKRVQLSRRSLGELPEQQGVLLASSAQQGEPRATAQAQHIQQSGQSQQTLPHPQQEEDLLIHLHESEMAAHPLRASHPQLHLRTRLAQREGREDRAERITELVVIPHERPVEGESVVEVALQ